MCLIILVAHGKDQKPRSRAFRHRAPLLIIFMRDGEKEDTQLFLSAIKTESVDQNIVDIAGALYRKWNPAHGIDANDAILAATVMQTGGRIYTLNTKHFPMHNSINHISKLHCIRWFPVLQFMPVFLARIISVNTGKGALRMTEMQSSQHVTLRAAARA